MVKIAGTCDQGGLPMTSAGASLREISVSPRHDAWESRSREIFERQSFMRLIGGRIERLAPGVCDIELPHRDDLCQQNVYLHGGVVTALADTSCGIASSTLMAPDAGILTVEFKINFLAPAEGERFVSRGKVVRSGRTLTIAEAVVYGETKGRVREIAQMLATMMALEGKGGMQGAR
jgi:uncharacterized protein (TIGR00369 family)